MSENIVSVVLGEIEIEKLEKSPAEIVFENSDDIEIQYFGNSPVEIKLVGLGPAGPTGLKGDKGEIGLKGDKGDKGEKGNDGVVTPALQTLHDQTVMLRNDTFTYRNTVVASAATVANDRAAVEGHKSDTLAARDQANAAVNTTAANLADTVAARNAAQTAEANTSQHEANAETAADDAAISAAASDAAATVATEKLLDIQEALANFDPTGIVQQSNNGSDFTDPAAVRVNIGAQRALETVSLVEAQEGLSTEERNWTAQRVKQATADKAPLANPTFSGTVAVPTADSGDSSAKAANTAWVRGEISKLVGEGVPEALDTLKELATALGNDPNFSATVLDQLAQKAVIGHIHTIAEVSGLLAALNAKAALASPTFTGTPLVPTAAPSTDNTQAANTAFVKAAIAAAGYSSSGHTHVIADTAGLQTALDAKAPLASPAFTGNPTATTAASGTRDTGIATNAFAMTAADNAAAGKADTDHIHPTSAITGLDTALAGKAALAGATFTGKVTLIASVAGGASFTIPHGVAPTAPVNGDMWTTTSGLIVRINGATRTMWDSSNLVQMPAAEAQAGTATTVRSISAVTLRAGIAAAPVGAATQTALDLKLDKAGGTMSGTLVLAGTGTNSLGAGGGDGASYTVSNITFKGHWGMAMATYDGTINGYYDFRLGKWDTKGGTFKNGIEYVLPNGGNYDLIASKLKEGGSTRGMVFNWNGQAGQPDWLWGGSDGTNMYVYNPSNFTVLNSAQLGGVVAANYLQKAGGAITGNLSVAGQISLGSSTVTAVNDFSKHIALFGTTYGLSITNSNLNFVSGSAFQWANGTTVRMTLSATGDLTATGNVTAYSDRRLKKKIKTITGALDMVDLMRGVRFEMNGRAGIGVVAQEMQRVAPELVIEADDKRKTLSVAYGNTVGILIEAIKELRKEVEELKAKK